LAGSTVKKALLHRFDRPTLAGFVNPQSYLQPGGVELMSPEGTVSIVPYEDLKNLCFVQDFDAPPPERKVFHARPKMDGLWIRARFRDGDTLEGVLPNNLLQLDPYGFMLTPPDPDSNNQRVFVPRAALLGVQVLGVVGSPLRRPKRKPPAAKDQIALFE
jgi:hypothetical protein